MVVTRKNLARYVTVNGKRYERATTFQTKKSDVPGFGGRGVVVKFTPKQQKTRYARFVRR